MRLIFRSLLLFLHALLDVLFTIFSLGFYASGHFSLSSVLRTFEIRSYSYWTSPLDFVVLTVIRQCLLVVAIAVKRTRRDSKKRMLVFDVISIIQFMIITFKILAFDESPELMKFAGIYMNTVSSIIFTCSLLLFIQKLVLEPSGENYGRLTEDNENGPSTKDEEEERLPLKTHLWHIVKLCGNQWKWFLTSYILLLIDCALNLIEPAIYSQMMTNAIQMKSFSILLKSCVILGIVQVTESTISTLKYACMQYAEKLTARHVRVSLFQSILRQEISFFDENKTGQLMSRVSHDSESISNSLPTYVETFTTNLITLLGVAPIMFYCSWQLSISTFISFPITYLITKHYGLYIEKLAEKENDATAVSNETVEEVLSAIRTVRSFAAEYIENNRYLQNTNDWFAVSMKSVIAGTFYNYSFSMIGTIRGIFIYIYGGYLTLNGRMTPDLLLTFIFYNWRLYVTLSNFSSLFSDLMTTIGSSRKVIKLLNRTPTQDFEEGKETPEIKGHIVFEGVEFAYPTRPSATVLNGVSLSIEPGKTVALVGPSGNGKSTLVSLIEQFYTPQSGRILLDGTPIQSMDHHHYHQKIALVSQEPSLFSGTIRENIMYGIENGTEEAMMKAAELANVNEFVAGLEDGYDTKCGEKGVQMSGGQKQRIAIARALIRNPRVLILDEATSALDSESEGLVQEALNRCARERTVIVIAHRLSTVRNADRIAVIEKGRIAEIGSHDDLMKNEDGLYCKLVRRQLDEV